MATRFTYQFITARDETFRVDIDDADHVGSSTEIDAGPEGFGLRYDGDVDKVVPGIVGSAATIPIVVTADNQSVINTFADDVRTSAETRFTVAIYQTIGITTTLYWVGYVLKDLSGFEDRGDVYIFTLKAADGLARMKFVDYADSGAPYGSLKFITHLINCLTEVGNTSYWGGSDVWLRTVVNWTEGGMPAIAAGVDPLNYSRVSGEVFTERRNTTDDAGWKFDSVYKVLDELCTAWGARLMLSDGAWRFEQVRERMEENFYERRYSTAGTLLSSTNAANYDRAVLQTGSAHRLTGGAFNYLPALQKVEVEYKHSTYVNQIGGQSYRWQKDSTYSNQTYTVSGISFDSDSFFRVSGYVTLDVSTTYTMPWRVVFGILLRLPDNPYRLRSLTTAVQVVPTAPIYKINREPVTWTATDSGLFYEISTNVITSGKFKGAIPFSFQTPVVPAGQKSFSINFASLIRGEYSDGSPATLTFTDWKFHDLVLTINGLDTAANFEEERLYKSSNTVTGNSDALTIKPAFGHAVKAWTPTKIEVTNNGTDWTNSTATWDRGADTNNDEFGELLARQLMAMQQQPVETYSGTLKAIALKAHSRITLPDNSTWLINRAEMNAKEAEWRVEMLKTGIANGADIVSDTPIGIPGPETDPLNPFGLVSAPTDGIGSTTAQSLDGPGGVKNIANTVSTNVPTGTVTSIPVDLPVKGGTIKDNDVIIVYDPQTDTTHVFTVDGDVPNGNTTITVDSTTTTIDIPVGAQVIYPDVNYYTTSTGGGGAPGGTISGIGTAGRVAYFDTASSIAADTLYWDATNNRLGVNKSSPAVTVDIQTANGSDGLRIQSDGTLNQDVWGVEMVGTATGPYTQRGRIGLDVFSNSGASPVGQAIIFKIDTDTVGTYTPLAVYVNQLSLNFAGTYAIQGLGTGNRIRIETAGGVFSVTNWLLTNSSYTTNDTTARLKLVGSGTTSSSYGLKIHDGGDGSYFVARDDKRIGILTTSPAVSLDVASATDSIALPGGTTAQRPAVNNSVRYNSTVGGFEGRVGGVWYRLTSNLTPTIAAGVAAGTTPGTPSVFGNDLGGQISITTGTACTTGALVTVTFNQALDAGAVITVMLTPRNATTAAQYGRFYVGSSGNTSFVITAATAPDDSTEYVFNYSINQ